MNLRECTDFANEIQVCYMATTEGSQPHVRGFLMWYADETGFYFHTGDSKSVCKQLKANPRIEVCFLKQIDEYNSKMLRVSGEVEFIEDNEMKNRLIEERPFLKKINESDPALLQIFRIYKGEAHFWTMADNLKESEIPRVNF